MASPAICSPRSARLLLTGTVEMPVPKARMSSDVLTLEDLQTLFPGRRLTRSMARRLRCNESPGDNDLQKKLPALSLPPPGPLLSVVLPGPDRPLPVSPAQPVSILKHAGSAVKPRGRHVSFGDVTVHEVERFPWRVFLPPRFAVFEPKRQSVLPPPPSPPPSPGSPVEALRHLPRRQRHVEYVPWPSWKEVLGAAACWFAAVGFLAWLG